MSEIVTLAAKPRAGTGSRAAGKLRKQGLIPAVIYGHKQPPVHVAVPADEFGRAVRVLKARMFTLAVDGRPDPEVVLVKDLQWDHLGSVMLHVDFERHSLTERVRVTVPVELRGAPKATGGGVLDQPLHQLHVECPGAAIPDSIRVDLTDLALGRPIHIRDLKLPDQVAAVDSPDLVVVQLRVPGAEPAAAEAGPAEPEVLTARKPKDAEKE